MLSFATDASDKALPDGVAEFATEYDVDCRAIMAALIIMTLATAVLLFGLQRQFVGGLVAGAVKG